MFTVRNTIAAAVVIVVVSLVAGVISLFGEPDSDGRASDSYGTRWNGARAVYELLAELGVPVERRLDPPSPERPTATTLVFWQPDADLVAVEPAYLQRLLPWVEQGGRLFVTPRSEEPQQPRMPTFERESVDPTIWEALKITSLNVERRPDPATAGSAVYSPSTGRYERIRRKAEGSWDESWNPRPPQWTTATIQATGSLAPAATRAKTLRYLRDDACELKGAALKKADGLLKYVEDDGEEHTLAAAFRRGQGEIVVVADAHLLSNAALSGGDNAVLAYDLLAPAGRGVVFDEFYHGLSVRGNPLWLMTRSRYAVGMATLSVIVGLLLWRRAVALGPPLETRPRSRRTILEYVEAMAHLFRRGSQNRRFIFEETYNGALRRIAERCNLPAVDAVPEQIGEALRRRRPKEAADFQAAVAAAEAVRAGGGRVTDAQLLSALQGICRCL